MEPFNSRRAAAHARNAMVASSQPLAAQVGLQVLKDGGNAVDAAIAVAAVVNVTEPMMNGLGGDAFILVHWQGKLYGLNASGRCPHAMTRKTFSEAGWKRMPQVGWGSVSVPGAPDGYLTLHERFGSKKFSDLIEPAATFAEEGVAVGQKIAHMWEWGASKLRLFDHSVHEFLPQGKAPKPGEIFRQPNLARTWRNLGKHGRDYYYSGELARKIVAASDSGGGYLKLPDLASQRSEWMDPVSTVYRGYRVDRNASQRTGSHCSYDAADFRGIRHRWYLPERPRCGGTPDFGALNSALPTLNGTSATRVLAKWTSSSCFQTILLLHVAAKFVWMRRSPPLRQASFAATRPTSPWLIRIATLSHSLQAFRTSSVRVSWSVTQASLCTTEPRNFR